MHRPLASALAVTMMLAGCQNPGPTPPRGGYQAPATAYTPTGTELDRARGLHEKVVGAGKVYSDAENPAATQYLNAVTARVSAQRPPGAVPVRAFIVKDDDINAFTTGAGYLYFNRGLLKALQNEAQLAMIVGHEIAHVDAGHIARGAADEARVDLLTGLGAAVLENYGVGGIAGSLGELGVGLAGKRASAYYSQGAELEADDIGLVYAMRAGYDGIQAASTFRVLSQANGPRGRLADFFASHPNSEGRQRTIAAKAAATGQPAHVGAEAYARMLTSLR